MVYKPGGTTRQYYIMVNYHLVVGMSLARPEARCYLSIRHAPGRRFKIRSYAGRKGLDQETGSSQVQSKQSKAGYAPGKGEGRRIRVVLPSQYFLCPAI